MTHIPGYLQAAFFAVLFMLFINGEIGSALLYAILLANLISTVLLLLSKKHFTATLCGLSGVTECGRNIEFELVLKKKGFCFLPYIEICLAANNSIHLRTALLFRREVTVRGEFTAEHSGLNKLLLENIIISDFLGNFHFNIRQDQQTQMAVLPRIVEYAGPDVLPNMLPSEEEETEEGAATRSGGMPGYEHREYVPGDSPRRVNYKLSAKRGTLMVRLDESNGHAATHLYISDGGLPACCDQAFALASRLIMHGGTVKITHKNDSRIAATPETLDKLREWLAFREYAYSPEPASVENVPADTAVTFFGDGQIRRGT